MRLFSNICFKRLCITATAVLTAASLSACSNKDKDDGRQLTGADTAVSVSDFSRIRDTEANRAEIETEKKEINKPVIIIDKPAETEKKQPETKADEEETKSPVVSTYSKDYDFSDETVKNALLSSPAAQLLIQEEYSDYVSQNDEARTKVRTFSAGTNNAVTIILYADTQSGTSNGKIEIRSKDPQPMKDIITGLNLDGGAETVEKIISGDYDGEKAGQIGLADIQSFTSQDGTLTTALTKNRLGASDAVPGWIDMSQQKTGTVTLSGSIYDGIVNADNVLNELMSGTFGEQMALESENVTNLSSIQFDLDGNMVGADAGYEAIYNSSSGVRADIKLSDDGQFLLFNISEPAAITDKEILAKCEHICRRFFNIGFDINEEIGSGYEIDRITVTASEDKMNYELKVKL